MLELDRVDDGNLETCFLPEDADEWLGVEFINEWNAGRDVKFHNLCIGNAIKIFDQGAD